MNDNRQIDELRAELLQACKSTRIVDTEDGPFIKIRTDEEIVDAVLALPSVAARCTLWDTVHGDTFCVDVPDELVRLNVSEAAFDAGVDTFLAALRSIGDNP